MPFLECKPENLGLSTGLISADNITVSSQDPVYNKGELGNCKLTSNAQSDYSAVREQLILNL